VRLRPALRGVLLASAASLLGLRAGAGQPAAEGWRPFTATWTLSGQRSVLATEGERPASIVSLSGPLTITGGEGLGRGFLGQVIGFDDGAVLLVGRAVFSDEHGDRIFCTLKAESIGTGRRAAATVTGGTGRYAGLEGSFSFAWQYVVDTDGGEVTGRAMNIEGRTRQGPSAKGGGNP